MAYSDAPITTSSPSKIVERNSVKPFSTLKAANTNLKTTITTAQKGSSDRGLSLLWVVIIVLLILWALGLIGGIGSSGLIHLLLVIALILLILWLLKVI